MFKKVMKSVGRAGKHILKSLFFSLQAVPYFLLQLPLAVWRPLLGVQKRKLVFVTNTFSYTCNPKYICEEMLRRNTDVDIVWVTDADPSKIQYYPKTGVRLVKIGTLACYREVFSAGVWVNNGIVFSDHFGKKKNQCYIQTMHGSLGIKRLDNAILGRKNHGLRGQITVRREEKNTDLVITNSLFEENVFRESFWYKTPMLRLGHARTDILFSSDQNLITRIKEKICAQYGIPLHKKLVLYAPTHRAGLTGETINVDYAGLIAALRARFGHDYAVLFRFHDRSSLPFEKGEDEAIVFDVTKYPDIQELMLISDIGITDYSSWIYDFVLTKKPGFIYATDLRRYNNTTGFYYELEETPFPICQNNAELMHSVSRFDEATYLEKVNDFLHDMKPADDGHSAERIVDKILEIIGAQ